MAVNFNSMLTVKTTDNKPYWQNFKLSEKAQTFVLGIAKQNRNNDIDTSSELRALIDEINEENRNRNKGLFAILDLFTDKFKPKYSDNDFELLKTIMLYYAKIIGKHPISAK